MNYISQIQQILVDIERLTLEFSRILPVEIFVTLGSFLEEIISPIPGPLVLTTGGVIAFAKGYNHFQVLALVLISTFAKTIGTYFFYYLADKSENWLLKVLEKWFGFHTKSLEYFGKYLNNTSADDVVLVILRALPVIPSLPVSVLCGLLKINVKTYIISTFIGFFIKNTAFIYIGYLGITSFDMFVNEFQFFNMSLLIPLLVCVLLLGLYIYFKLNEEKITSFLDRKFHKKDNS